MNKAGWIRMPFENNFSMLIDKSAFIGF